MGVFGLVIALLALILMALRGVNIIVAGLISTLIVLVTNNIDVATGLNEYFAFGKLGAFTFFGRFFLLFVAGAVFGALMSHSGAASSIAHTLAEKLGAHRSLWIIALACAVLTYGGVSAFVVLFSVNALGQQLIQRAGIPKHLMVGAVALGAGTFTLTAMPGTPSLNNVLAAAALETDLYAAPVIGFIGSLVMFGLGMWYLESQRKRLALSGGGIGADLAPQDDQVPHDNRLPHWLPSSLPLLVVLGLIALPTVLGKFVDPQSGSLVASVVTYAKQQPIFWPVICLVVGWFAIILLLPKARQSVVSVIGEGANNAVMPVLNTAIVIGFGSVVSQTESFQWFVDTMLNLDMSPLLSLLSSVSVIAGITGSSSGGLQIFLQTMGQSYLELGIPADVLHRLAAMASGGLDSLPHCGGVIAFLTIMGSNHKESYKEIFIVSVLIPIFAALIGIAMAGAFYL